MKYTIEGFSQEKLVELGFDAVDTVILRWFVDFMQTDRMVAKEQPEDKQTYFWVKYQGVINDLPYLGIENPESMARRFKKLCEAGVLIPWLSKQATGTFTLFRLNGKVFCGLLTDGKHPTPADTPPDPKVVWPPDPKVVTPPDSKVDPKDSSTKKNSSTKNIIHGLMLITPESIPFRLAKLLYTEHLKCDPKFLKGKKLEATFARWGEDIEKLIRLDEREEHEIAKVIRWCQADSFWQSNILSGAKLRDKYPQLVAKVCVVRPGCNAVSQEDKDMLNKVAFG